MAKIRELFRSNLKRIRVEKGFKTMSDFAKAAEIPYRTYQDIEGGAGSIPQGDNLATIARVLKIEESELFQTSVIEQRQISSEEAIKILAEKLGLEISILKEKQH